MSVKTIEATESERMAEKGSRKMRFCPHLPYDLGMRSLLVLVALLVAGPVSLASADPPDSMHHLEALVRGSRDEAALLYLTTCSAEFRERPEIRFLTSRLFDRIGEYEEALAVLPATKELPEAVREDVDYHRALLYERLDRCKDALPLLERAAERKHERRGAARAKAAGCAQKLGRHRLYLRLSRQLPDTFETRMARAEAAAALKRHGAAIDELIFAFIEFPEKERAVREALASIPGGRAAIKREQRLARVSRLMVQRRLKEAEQAFAALPQADRRSLEGRRLEGRLFFEQKKYKEAAVRLRQTGRGSGSEARKDRLLAARALYRSGQHGPGTRALQQVARTAQNTPEGDLASWLVAELALEAGGAGRNVMRRFLRSPAAGRLIRESQRARLALGIDAFERNQETLAHEYFTALRENAPHREDRLAGMYWQARSLEKMKGARNLRAAKALYQELLDSYPLDYYGFLARRRLLELGETVALDALLSLPVPEGDPPPTRPEPEAARFYRELGLIGDAERIHRETLPDDRRLRIAFYLKRRDARAGFLVARADPALRSKLEPSTRFVFDAAYPRPHQSIVERELRRSNGVPMEWIYATMRQESGYDARAVSRAGARGLLQLMPATAAELAKERGMKNYDRSKLFDAETNLTLGIMMMTRLASRYGGNLVLMAAGYNAGPGRVRRWLESFGGADLDLFVEKIPFEETRRYVKRVSGHALHYRYLSGESDPYALNLPERIER